MQTEYIIRVVVDMRDKNKMPPIENAVKRHAAQLNAVVQLLVDGQPAKVTAFSDDFFVGQAELDYLAQDYMPEQVPAKVEPPMSDDFLKALKGE
jgi:hypothetical protein